ncbi:flippase [Dietzia kunjamensis]|uniref:flippase n=1 Tax=Dietzia kunjamensis TaxID=322509 RepID=UPI000BDE6DB5|nr:flippase [Dietzia kunjamensis]USX47387.1 flippase [Dietzia kunjamensis]
MTPKSTLDDRPGGDVRGPGADSESRSLLANSGAMVAGRILTAVLGWAGSVVIARSLSPDDWGRYSFVFGLLGVLSLVTDLGVGRVVLARLTGASCEESRRVAGSFILLRFVLGLIGFAVAVAYAAITGMSTELVAVVAFAAIGVVLATPANALMVLYQARLRLVTITVWDAVAHIVQLTLVLIVARTAPSLVWFIVPVLAKELTVLVARAAGVLRGRLGPRPVFSAGTAYWGEMLREAVPISIGFALIMLLTKVDILILQRLDTFESVGMYAIGYKFSDLVIMVAVTISVPFTTVLVRAWPDDDETFRQRTRQAMIIAGVLGLLAVVGFWPTADFFVGLLYGERFVEAAGTAQLLVLASALSGATNIGLVALIAARKLTVFPWVAAGGVLLNVALNLVAIPRWSYEGAAAATLVTEALVFVSVLLLVQRSIGIRGVVPWGPLVRLALLAAAVVAPSVVLITYSAWPWLPVVLGSLLVFLLLAELSDSLEGVSLIGRVLPPFIGRRFVDSGCNGKGS